MLVCGVSGRPGRGAAALVSDGTLVAAVSDHAPTDQDGAGGRLPRAAIDACLSAAGATWQDVSHAVVAVGGDGGRAARPALEAPAGASRSSAAAPPRTLP
jgi:predicted NodU family carbamoyl transferase